MSRFDSFKQHMSGKRVTVIGIGISNKPLIELLVGCGARVRACDKADRSKIGEEYIKKLEDAGVELRLGQDYLENLDGDYIFRTPGMRPDVPELLRAAASGSVITSEMECFVEVCPCPIIGITGSDGKTTTTTVISKIAEQAGIKCHVGGNIGRPLLADCGGIDRNDLAVLELSSFQLFTMKKSPQTAVITNLAPNHLDIHKDMEEYVSAKQNIFAHQDQNGVLVLNADNKYTEELAKKAKGRVIMFSGTHELENGVFEQDGYIVYKDGAKIEHVLKISDIFIPGRHNVENYMAAIAATRGVRGVCPEVIDRVAKDFRGVEHRIEFVRELNGVRYYNDSIASSPSRTIAGLKSFDKKVILIAGGYDKHIPFEPLGNEAVKRVKLLILTGDTSDKIEAAVRSADGFADSGLKIIKTETLRDAVEQAAKYAQSGDIVTMSPACASFDRYKNFEQRGNLFKQIVSEL